MELVATKWIALEGSCLLAVDNEDFLRTQLPKSIMDRIMGFSDLLNTEHEREVFKKFDSIAFCEAKEGGIYRALWDMGETFNLGIEAHIDRIPIRQETIEMCEILDVDPYKLTSGGCMLAACEDGEGLVSALSDAGIFSFVIGCVTAGKDRVIITGDKKRFISPGEL